MSKGEVNMLRKRTTTLLFLTIVLILSLWPTSLALMQEAVTLNVREMDVTSNFPSINSTVTVVNPSGVPIDGLEASNFEVLEDGDPIPVDQVTAQTNANQPIAVCMVLDLSGSAPLDQVQAAANRFLDTLGPNDRICLIGFNMPLDFNTPDPTKEVEFTTDKDLVRAVIGDLESVGESAVYEAIYKGVLWTAEETADRRAVIVMTDGYDTISRQEIATADTPKAAARDKHIPIFTIGVYNPNYTSNPDYLRVLADETGGEYYEADPNNPQEMADRFERVVNLLRQEYRLTFSSNLEPLGEEDHTLTIRAITPSGEGEVQRTVTYQAPKKPIVIELQRDVGGEMQVLEPGQEVRGKALLVPRIAARNPIAKVEYYLDGQLAYTAMTDAAADYTHKPWEWTWNSQAAGEGEHTLEIIAYDDAGNVSGRFSLAVQVAMPSMTVLGVNIWLIVAIVAAIILLVAILLLVLRRPSREPAPGPTFEAPGPSPRQSPQTQPSPGAYSPPAQTAKPTPPPSPSAPGGEPSSTAVIGQSSDRSAQARSSSSPKTVSLRREPESLGWLIVESGVREGREFRLQNETSIGRSGDNDIILDDPATSRQHAKIKLEGQTFVIYDLGATNPTEVNRQEIVKHQLMDGDRVKIGETVLVFKQINQSQA
jgi:VWFA-related protein